MSSCGAPSCWRPWLNLGFILLGILGLVLGAFVIRESALALAEAMGVSELVIGLTLVSIGTSHLNEAFAEQTCDGQERRR